MKFVEHDGQKIAILSLDTLVIGSGCAGFNAADTLYDLGRRQIGILTEGVRMGTSRNTGSDKQTYYKLSLCSDAQDSVWLLAKNLFDGGSVNGDTALAALKGISAKVNLDGKGKSVFSVKKILCGEHEVGHRSD